MAALDAFVLVPAWPVVADERILGRTVTLGAGEHATVADVTDPEGASDA